MRMSGPVSWAVTTLEELLNSSGILMSSLFCLCVWFPCCYFYFPVTASDVGMPKLNVQIIAFTCLCEVELPSV